MKKTLLLFILLFAFSACGNRLAQPDREEVQDIAYIPAISLDYTQDFGLFTQKILAPGLFEPETGVYIGAYILSDRIVMGDIEAFEELVGVEHSFYTYFYKMGQPFPTEWVLDLIVNMKTPNIVVTPQNIERPFDYHLLRESAQLFGEINVPMFIHLFPVSHELSFDPEEYISFFRMARRYFNSYAPNVVLVWNIYADSLHLIERHYPGDDYTDWVGINLFVDSQSSISDVRAKLDFFHFHFQERKPMFISQLGISHFSSRNHAYHITEATLMMEEIFRAVRTDYPRIKAINYMSFNGIDPVNMRQGIYNFSITDNDRMTRAYRDSIRDLDNYFLPRIDFSAGKDLFSQRISHTSRAMYHDGEFYVRTTADIGIYSNIGQTDSAINIGSNEYYPLSLAAGRDFTIHADFNLRAVEIRRVN
ncbi:MAG: hypothetical protein FWE24_03290 [Defluviitaleaceae bacterium]|nr:hypothetical protein [Defluviitaleaceae bacterium]